MTPILIARLSGTSIEEEEVEEELEALENVENPVSLLYIRGNLLMKVMQTIVFQGLVTRAKKAINHIVQQVGFFGILLCASVSCNAKVLVCHVRHTAHWYITSTQQYSVLSYFP